MDVNKIPTAEELINLTTSMDHPESKGMIYKDIKDIMIEFAKLHVEAALRAASEKQVIEAYYEDWNDTENTGKDGPFLNDNNYEATYLAPVISGGKCFVVDKNSILNAYPLTNIK